MSSDKRARQKANRETKKEQDAKAAKRKRLFGQVKKYAGYALLFVASIVAFRIFFG
ncbi:MAG: hypothetical protein M3092_10195 [Actinomycetia bacterium]|nr:hypothetical protein [Actinomycetes bacterium]